MQEKQKMVLAARLESLHGFNGQIKARALLSSCCEIFKEFPPVLDSDMHDQPVVGVVTCNPFLIIVSLAGIDSNVLAATFLGRYLLVPRCSFGQSTEDSVYIADLLNMDVFLVQDDDTTVRYGKVMEVNNYGGSYIVEILPDKKSIKPGALELYPFTRTCFPVVNLESGFLLLRKPKIAGIDDYS